GAEIGRNFVACVRSNPMPAALTGIGLAWLMVSTAIGPRDAFAPPRPAPDPYQDWSGMKFENQLSEAELQTPREENETEEAWQTRLDEARARVVGIAREASETAASFRQRIADAIAKARDSIRRNLHDMQDRVGETSAQIGTAVRQAGSKVMDGGRAARE